MKPNITIITLGVSDLDRAIAFYQNGLGFPLQENSSENIAFFKTQGTTLALYPRDKLAEDITIEDTGSGFSGFTLAHNVSSPEAVDATLNEAVKAGATLIKPGQNVFWGGYSGYFADPDGFYWEVAWDPYLSENS
ncbi:Lactoylglutathione lyase [Geitlerinema sp. FC II]|nr:Lactoylglutathione lyase [Geitlerinema sp. FC II]